MPPAIFYKCSKAADPTGLVVGLMEVFLASKL